MHRSLIACAAIVLLPLPGTVLVAQSPYATQVVSFDTHGGLGGGIFNPSHALGAPQGGGPYAGGTNVHSLGVGGQLTLQLGVLLRDGAGADFLVAENPFLTGSAFGSVFAEVCYVEVSSNGIDFARFPCRYLGPAVDPGPFGVATVGWYEGLAGQMPVSAGWAGAPAADPQDVVEAGGDAFDLADLRADPLVLQGRLHLDAVQYVRLVDVRGGIDVDSAGRPIRDCGSGSADIDAVTAIQHQGNAAADGPSVQLTIAADGRFTLSLDDPDGWPDLDPASLHLSLNGTTISVGSLLAVCQLTRASSTGFTLALAVPLPSDFRYRLAVALKDRAGHRSGAARTRP